MLGADVPPPGDGEGSGDAASDAARFLTRLRWALKIKKRWKPSPHHRQQQAQPPAVFFKDVTGSKTLFLLKTDSWLGWTETQTKTHQAVGSSDAALREGLGEVQAKYRVALADFVETYDARRRVGAFPVSLLKTNFDLGSVQTYQIRVSEPLLKQLLTTFTVTTVVSSVF